MTHRIPICATLAALLAASGWAADAKTVTLKAAPLPSQDVLTPVSLKAGFLPSPDRGGYVSVPNVPAMNKGAITAHELKFKDSTSLTIGEAQLTLAVPGPSTVTISLGGAKPVSLKNVGDGWAPVPIPISKKDKLLFSVPHGSTASRSGLMLTYRNGAVASGKLDADTLFVYDDDCDGVYKAGRDALSLNSGYLYAPVPELIAGRKQLWQVGELAEDGGKATLTPADGPTGKLKIVYNTPAGEGHVYMLGGKTAAIGVGPGKDPFIVAPGDYALQYGLLLGAKRNPVAAFIPSGKPVPTTVAADGTATATFGAPYRFEFVVKKVNEKFTIAPSSIRLLGAADEIYVGYAWQPTPTVIVNGKRVGAFGFG